MVPGTNGTQGSGSFDKVATEGRREWECVGHYMKRNRAYWGGDDNKVGVDEV